MAQEFNPIEAFVSLLGLSVMTATVRSILSNEFTWKSWGRKVVLSFFVGGVVGAALHDQEISPSLQGALVAFSALTADMILLLSLEIIEALQKNPRIVIDYILHRPSSTEEKNDE